MLVRARLSQLLVAAARSAGAMTKRSDVESMAHLLRFDVRLPVLVRYQHQYRYCNNIVRMGYGAGGEEG